MSPAREAALRLLRLMASGTIVEEASMRQVLEALLFEEEKLLDQNRRLINEVLGSRRSIADSATEAIKAMMNDVAKEEQEAEPVGFQALKFAGRNAYYSGEDDEFVHLDVDEIGRQLVPKERVTTIDLSRLRQIRRPAT